MVSDLLDRDQECSILEEQTLPTYLMPALTNYLGQFPSFVPRSAHWPRGHVPCIINP